MNPIRMRRLNSIMFLEIKNLYNAITQKKSNRIQSVKVFVECVSALGFTFVNYVVWMVNYFSEIFTIIAWIYMINLLLVVNLIIKLNVICWI